MAQLHKKPNRLYVLIIPFKFKAKEKMQENLRQINKTDHVTGRLWQTYYSLTLTLMLISKL